MAGEPNQDDIRTAMVAGSGTMGRGIAISFARGGHKVSVLSRDAARVAPIAQGVAVIDTLPETPPDFIIEAVAEDLAIKRELFARLEDAYGGTPILATNTSGLSMAAMAAGLAHPQRFIGVHYMQPAEALPLVEVIRIPATSDAVVAATVAALRRNGQDALILNKPVPGFLANRLQHAMLHEAFALIEDGVCSAADIDAFARKMFGPRLAVSGLIEQKDISGLHITAATQRNLVPQLHHTGRPVALLQDMVAAGDHGVRSGRGFYDWRTRDLAAHKARAADKLARILAILAED